MSIRVGTEKADKQLTLPTVPLIPLRHVREKDKKCPDYPYLHFFIISINAINWLILSCTEEWTCLSSDFEKMGLEGPTGALSHISPSGGRGATISQFPFFSPIKIRIRIMARK
jgi:hypothetical protein